MSPASSRRRASGVVRYSLLILVVLFAIAVGVTWWQVRRNNEADLPSLPTVAATGQVLRPHAGTDELLMQARDAMAAQRLLAPAGNNAFEFYLAVLQREPGNRVAQDALREIFPFAAHAAEQSIDSGDSAEAQRQIELLRRADPQNYTLTLLQAKLTAQQAAAAQEAQLANRRDAAPSPTSSRMPVAPVATVAPMPPPPAAAANPPAAPPAAAVVAPKPVTPTPSGSDQLLSQLNVESTEVKAAPRTVVRAHAPAVTTPVADASGAVAPVLTRRVEPVYPTDAKRTRREGWVDVTFTVQADGSVTGASVANAEPRYVFDRAALSAVSRWQFSPGTQDGKPVALPMKQRIEFRL